MGLCPFGHLNSIDYLSFFFRKVAENDVIYNNWRKK